MSDLTPSIRTETTAPAPAPEPAASVNPSPQTLAALAEAYEASEPGAVRGWNDR